VSGFCFEAQYSVGGTVSGLAGSGLVLFDYIGGSVAISRNGSFTFPAKYATNDGVDVTVSNQPVNPSQPCVVTNGGFGVNNSNVTDVSVVCTTGVANAKLTGTYKVVSFEFNTSALLALTFDGAGNFSGTNVENGAGTVGGGAVSGTYAVATDGTLTIGWNVGSIFFQASTITGGLSADGNSLVASQTTFGDLASPRVLFGIKQGKTNFSNANLTGSYTAVRYDYNSTGDSGGLSTVTFDGAGNFAGTGTLNNAGTVSSMAVSGTYTVAADGTLTISPTGGSTITGGLSADGNTLVTSQTNAGVSPEILVGIKQGQSNFSNASLKGTFTLITHAYNSTGDLGTLLTVTFDGAGNFDGTGAQNLALTVSSMAVSGTYTVAAEGTLTISPTGGSTSTGGSTITGGLSANGSTLVASQTTSSHPPTVLFAVLL
jgi:hypothetical protein